MSARKRPPGVVWIDWSGVTAVVACEACKLTFGPWLDLGPAKAYAAEHRATHPGARLNADDYIDEALIKNPGGRPRLSPEVCTLDDCDTLHYSRGLCERHYRAALKTERQAA